MAVTTTTAIVLRHQDERERDRLIVALSADHGLLRIRARGSKRSTAKLAGSLEPLTEVQLTWADGRTTGLATGSVVTQRWPIFRTDLVASVSGQWLAELLEHIMKPEQPAEQVYQFVQQALNSFSDQVDWSLGRRWLALDRLAYQLLSLEGFVPSHDHCPRCQRPMPSDEMAYDPLVGFVHGDEAATGCPRITGELLAFLESGQTAVPERVIFRQLHSLLETLITHTLDRPLKSERVLRAVFRQARLSSEAQYGMIEKPYAQSPADEGSASGTEAASR